jgi:hypothetical protein
VEIEQRNIDLKIRRDLNKEIEDLKKENAKLKSKKKFIGIISDFLITCVVACAVI